VCVARICRKILAVPLVDSIRWNTYQHRSLYPINKRYMGAFEWGFLYKEVAKQDHFHELRMFTKPYP
jgi:hypothetical protein